MNKTIENPQNEDHLLVGYSGIFFDKKAEGEAAGTGDNPVNTIDKRKMVVAGSLIVLAAVVVVCAGIKAAQVVVAPFFMACFLAIILTAPLRWLKSRGFSDLIASLIIIAGVLIFGISIIWILSGSVNRFLARMPEYTEKTNLIIAQIDSFLEPYGFSVQGGEKKTIKNGGQKMEQALPPVETQSVPKEEPVTITEESDGEKEEPTEETATEESPPPFLGSSFPDDPISTVGIVGYARIVMKELGRLTTLCFIVMILVVFMMFEASRLPKKIINAFGANGITNEHLQTIVDKVWKYMVIKSLISLLVGSLVWLMLVIADVDYAMLWGLIAFFFNFIPNVGSIIAAVPGISLALFDHGFGTCLAVTVGYLMINQGLGYYIEPIWLGDGLGISPLVILLSLIFFGYLLGMIGMFLSAPLAIVVKIICDSFEETRWVGTLMSDK